MPIIFIQSLTFAQQDHYRMQLGFAFYSSLFLGTQSFDKVSRTGFNDLSYYEYEEYFIQYPKTSPSIGGNLRLSLNWLDKKKYVLRQSSSIIVERYQEEIIYQLTDYKVGNTSFFPNESYEHDFQIGDIRTAELNGIGFGLLNELVFIRKLESHWNVGGGLSFNIIRRNDADYFWSFEEYGPNDQRLTYGSYTTKQLGLIIQAERTFPRWNAFINLNQSILTAKKNSKKGGDYFPEEDHLHPLSHNLDYRFPLQMNAGIALKFSTIR